MRHSDDCMNEDNELLELIQTLRNLQPGQAQNLQQQQHSLNWIGDPSIDMSPSKHAWGVG